MCKTFSFSFFLIYVYLFYFTHNLTWLTLRHPKLYTYTYVIFDINITYMHNTLKYSPNKRNYCWTKNLTLKNKNLIGNVVIDLPTASKMDLLKQCTPICPTPPISLGQKNGSLLVWRMEIIIFFFWGERGKDRSGVRNFLVPSFGRGRIR
jgi:hypothetical protein